MNNTKEWMIRLLTTLLGMAVGVFWMSVALQSDIGNHATEMGIARTERTQLSIRIDRLENNYDKIIDKLANIQNTLTAHDAETRK